MYVVSKYIGGCVMTALHTDSRDRPLRRTLFMLWPQSRLHAPPTVTLPPGYGLRTYRPGDEPAWLVLQAQVEYDLSSRDLERLLRDYMAVLLPRGLFFVIHTASGQAVATAGAVHNTRNGMFPFGGELGWVATVPPHRLQGLGRAVSAAATARRSEAGYASIRLGTQDERLPALRRYLQLGYRPYRYTEEMSARWQDICTHIGWPFTPSEWPR
jgi:mycothiol synthase